MKTLRLTIDERLLKDLDRLTRARKTTRLAFIRAAIKAEIKRDRLHELEARHAQGYASRPVMPGEFHIWANERGWWTSHRLVRDHRISGRPETVLRVERLSA